MQDPSNHHQFIKELLRSYEGLRLGTSHSYLEEEDFEVLCDYFDDQENLKKSLEIIELGISIHPFSSALKLRKADLLVSCDKLSEAESLLETTYILDNLNPQYYILKFEIEIKKKHTQEAEAFLIKHLPLFHKEDQIDMVEECIEVLMNHFEHEKISKYLFLLLSIDETNEYALLEIPFWAQLGSAVEESISLHLALIQKHPYNYLMWFNLGIGYQCLGLHEKAIEAYEYCLAIQEDFEFALRNIAAVCVSTKAYLKALMYLETLCEHIDRPESQIHAMMALCYVGTNNKPLAIKHYQNALSLDQHNAELYYLLARVFLKEKKYLEAINHDKKAIRIESGNFKYNQLLAQGYLAMKQYKMAANHYFNALMVKKKNKRLWAQYLRCFILSKEYESGYKTAQWAGMFLNKVVFAFFEVGFLLLNKDEESAKKRFDTIISQKDGLKHLRYARSFFDVFESYEWIKIFLI